MNLESNIGKRLESKYKKIDIADALNALISIPGKIRCAKVATAYVDGAALSAFIDFVGMRSDARGRAIIEFYIEKNSATRLWRELAEAEESGVGELKGLAKLLRDGGDETVIIRAFAVQSGTLFHSKAMYIEANRHRVVVVGSLNLTVNGLTKNEELVIAIPEIIGRKSIANRLILEAKEYISKENFRKLGRIVPMSSVAYGLKNIDAPLSLREALLNGVIWYERKEMEAFAFPLQLPKELRKVSASVRGKTIPHLKSSLESALLVLPLLKMEFPSERAERARWRRRLCMPTCFGLWSPLGWEAEIEEEHNKYSLPRLKHLDSVYKVFRDKPTLVSGRIVKACSEIWSALQSAVGSEMVVRLPSDMEARANGWVRRVGVKLGDDKYRAFLATGLVRVDVPDFWSGSAGDAKVFEGSFLESVAFELSRPRNRSLIARRLSKLGADEGGDLKEMILENASYVFGEIDGSEVDVATEYELEDEWDEPELIE